MSYFRASTALLLAHRFLKDEDRYSDLSDIKVALSKHQNLKPLCCKEEPKHRIRTTRTSQLNSRTPRRGEEGVPKNILLLSETTAETRSHPDFIQSQHEKKDKVIQKEVKDVIQPMYNRKHLRMRQLPKLSRIGVVRARREGYDFWCYHRLQYALSISV